MITQYQPELVHTMTKNGEPYATVHSAGYWLAEGRVNNRLVLAEGRSRSEAMAAWRITAAKHEQ